MAVVARSERTEITQDRVLQELAKLAFANASDLFNWGPDGISIKAKADLTPEQQAAVAEVSQTVTEKGGTIRLKLHDKRAALVDIGRHLGMFLDRHEHSGEITKRVVSAEPMTAEEWESRYGANSVSAGGSTEGLN